MNSQAKIAVAAAVAGALVVKAVLKNRREKLISRRNAAGPEAAYDDSTRVPPSQVADTNGVGDQSRQQEPQPQDWRGAQNVLDS
jgi:hypothetical protein